MTLVRNWNGYKIYGDSDDPNVLIIVDQDGNRARFDAGTREWGDLDDLIALLHDDLINGWLEFDPA